MFIAAIIIIMFTVMYSFVTYTVTSLTLYNKKPKYESIIYLYFIDSYN